MRVKLKKPMAGGLGVFASGAEVEVPDAIAMQYIADGAAEPVRGPVVERAVEPEPEVEKAVVEPKPKPRKRQSKKRASKKR